MDIIKDKKSWNHLIIHDFEEFDDVYFKLDYFQLYEENFKVQSEGIFWEDSNIKIFWTHFIRNIDLFDDLEKNVYKDVTTPYGYGGPIISQTSDNVKEIKKSLKKFMKEYTNYAIKNNYVSEFIRFHPILENWRILNDIIDIQYINDVIVSDLTPTIDNLWSNLSKNTRRYTRKAKNEFKDVKVTDSPSDTEIKNFMDLYHKTMDKQNASKKYYFTFKFLKDHFKFNNLLIWCENDRKEIGSSAIFLKGSTILHYHLGSTNYNFKTSPLRLVLWSAMKWAKENGLKWLHFGGGRGVNDSLYRFKKGFSNIIRPFYVGKIIFQEKVYNRLVSLKFKAPGSLDFFPIYRAGSDLTIV
ncbi:MAG: GNAT family N-acetyltransferase [Candidatus Helarchaeota archaeon]